MTKQNTSKITRIRRWYQGLPDKKRYLEFVTAFLSIPVLMTVLITNTMNLKNQNNEESIATNEVLVTPSSKPTPEIIPIYITLAPTQTDSTNTTSNDNPTPTPSDPELECKKGVGPVAISYPQENEVIDSDPICIDISRQSSEYCSIVWSYKLDDTSWSEYLDKSICLYGVTPGEKSLQLKIRSIVGNEEINLTRNFSVAETAQEPEATTSATTQ